MTTLQLMRLPVLQALPAGLLDDKKEFFCHLDKVYALFNSSPLEFYSWPERLYVKVEEDMAQHPDAVQSLIDLGIEERLEMIWQYCRCRFGHFDGNADIDSEGKLLHTEYWDCGFRGKCPYEGRLCASIKAPNGIITAREIEVIKLMVDDMRNKEIASILNISETTVPVHQKNIYKKIGDEARRGSVIKFAIEHNIINHSKP